MNTVRKLSKSVPRHLSLVLGSTCRNVHAVVLPRLPYAHYADAFVLSRRPLRWGLRVRLPFTPLPAVRCRPPAHPHIVRIRKKGGVSASPRGCYSYASNPATTVSSVEESNAFAASVTGR